MKALLAAARSATPYLLIEVILPGGTMIALLMWAVRNRSALRTKAIALSAKGIALSAKGIALSAKGIALSAKGIALSAKGIALSAQAGRLMGRITGVAASASP